MDQVDHTAALIVDRCVQQVEINLLISDPNGDCGWHVPKARFTSGERTRQINATNTLYWFCRKKCWRYQYLYKKSESKGVSQIKCEVLIWAFTCFSSLQHFLGGTAASKKHPVFWPEVMNLKHLLCSDSCYSQWSSSWDHHKERCPQVQSIKCVTIV